MRLILVVSGSESQKVVKVILEQQFPLSEQNKSRVAFLQISALMDAS